MPEPDNDYSLYKFMSVNHLGRKTEYSGLFKTEDEARKWYQTHGIDLSARFNRTLVLMRKGEQVSVSWMQIYEKLELDERYRLPRAN